MLEKINEQYEEECAACGILYDYSHPDGLTITHNHGLVEKTNYINHTHACYCPACAKPILEFLRKIEHTHYVRY